MASKVQADKRIQEKLQSLNTDNPKTKHCLSNHEKKAEKEEERIRAQFQRLENEKQRIKQHKHEEFQRRLSQQAEDAAARKVVSTDRQRNMATPGQENTQPSRSAHSKSPGESKLFDYEITQPRSRRQLLASDLSAETSRTGADAGRTSEQSHNKGHRTSLPPSINILPEAKTAHSKTSGFEERTEFEMRPTGSRAGVAAERKVNFDDNKLGADMPKYQRARSKSISDPTKVQLPLISVEESEMDSDTQKLKDLYNLAIERVKSVDEALLSQAGGVPGAKMKTFSSSSFAKGFDTETLKELETILKDARIFSNRRSSQEDHTRPDLSTNRAQKKRIEHLERVLHQLKPEDKTLDFSPFKVLQCSYLRLSKSNIETLEQMCKAQGVDPGIHVHKDVTDYNIWEGLKDQRRDTLEAQAQVEAQKDQRRASLTVPGHSRMRRDSVETSGTGPQPQEPEPPVPVYNRQRRASMDVQKL